MKRIVLIPLIVLLILGLVALVIASDFTPQGDINLRNTYNITGAPYVNATIYYGNGSQLTGISSEYWNNMDSINATQMENSGGTLNILVSWFTTQFSSLFSIKTTDDLTEGSSNLYDNSSWNETHADTLYAPVNYGDDWNETYADTLYAGISTIFDGTWINFTDGGYMYDNGTTLILGHS